MRFNAQVFALAATGQVVSMIPPGPKCTPEIIADLAYNNIVKYVTLNCVERSAGADGYNKLGEEVMADYDCLTNFTRKYADTAHPVPTSGICRDHIQNLVVTLLGYTGKPNTSGTEYNEETGD